MSTETGISESLPKRGQLVQVRNRAGIVTNVSSANSPEQPMHLVSVDYLDGNPHFSDDQRNKDNFLRQALKAEGWSVIEIHIQDYDNDPMMHMYRTQISNSLSWRKSGKIQVSCSDSESIFWGFDGKPKANFEDCFGTIIGYWDILYLYVSEIFVTVAIKFIHFSRKIRFSYVGGVFSVFMNE